MWLVVAVWLCSRIEHDERLLLGCHSELLGYIYIRSNPNKVYRSLNSTSILTGPVVLDVERSIVRYVDAGVPLVAGGLPLRGVVHPRVPEQKVKLKLY